MAGTSWFERVIDHEVRAHWDDARRITDDARAEFPGASPDELVNHVIDRKARIAAFVGIGTGALAAIPAIGELLAAGTIVPEALYLAKVQVDVALVVALTYEAALSPDEARGIIVTCLVLALGADFVKAELSFVATKLTRDVVEAAILRMGERELSRLLARIGVNATRSGILKKVPLVAVPLNAAMNYGQIHAFGWAVKRFLSPSFVMCGGCGSSTGRLNRFCPACGAGLELA